MASSIPAVIENHLDAVRFWNDGKLLLGSSNLCGRYWNGSLWCFQNVEDAPNIEKCISGIDTESGVSDVQCLRNNMVAISLDSGCIELYRLDSDPSIFVNLFSSCEHDDIISSLSVNSDETKIVSSSYDKSIKVWDLQTWATVCTFRPVHSDIIWQVSCSTTDPHVMLSCSQDGKILLLDLRLPKPATPISTNPLQSIPTAISWKPQSNDVFAVGDDSGYVIIKDIRNSDNVIQTKSHTRSIFKIAFSKVNPSWLASCADDTKVQVMNIEKGTPNIIYHNDDHMDFVRGLTWSPNNELVSCGWDKKVIKHSISSNEMDVVNQNND